MQTMVLRKRKETREVEEALQASHARFDSNMATLAEREEAFKVCSFL